MTFSGAAFHIIEGRGPYQMRVVPSAPGSRKTRTEQYTYALCGQLVVRDRGQYCGLSIANPDTLRKPWCRGCVEAGPWSPKGVEAWKRHGYFQES